jgi:hypothetical protein
MSSAFYPQGMEPINAGISTNQSYVTWKGRGVFQNPIGITSTHVRPLTNLDPGNIFPTGFGLPRPIKHYRRGTVIPLPPSIITVDPDNESQYFEKSLVEYNLNRAVKTSQGNSLGGGNGGLGLMGQIMDTPGGYVVKDNRLRPDKSYIGIVDPANPLTPFTDITQRTDTIQGDCLTCQGVGLVTDWYPINDLTDKPERKTTNPLLCCNEEKKAIRRVLPTNTNIPKTYYQTVYGYLYNRCQTFKQREFNFVNGFVDPKLLELIKKYPFVTAKILAYSKPGDPISNLNLYVAQCNPNILIEQSVILEIIISLGYALNAQQLITEVEYHDFLKSDITTIEQLFSWINSKVDPERRAAVSAYLYTLTNNPYAPSLLEGPNNPKGCKKVYYKPNNPQYAQQGGVSSSTRTLKLQVDTITKNAADQVKYNRTAALLDLTNNTPNIPFIYKSKTPPCIPSTYIGNPFFFSGQNQNKKICSKRMGDMYKSFVSVYQRSDGNYIGATLP